MAWTAGVGAGNGLTITKSATPDPVIVGGPPTVETVWMPEGDDGEARDEKHSEYSADIEEWIDRELPR